jgi:hypothetical protein
MKRLILLFLCATTIVSTAQERAYGDGEFFKFRVHYGFITAGYATLEVGHEILEGKEVYHIKGYGKTTGISRAFFRVEDDYQSFVDKETDRPYRFIRKIDEGGHTKDIQIDFDHERGKALVNNKKHKTKEWMDFPKDAQDMVSAFYYLRNRLDVSDIEEGETIDMNDGNKMPVLIKADLTVGSLKASLSEFKGLKNSFRIQVD